MYLALDVAWWVLVGLALYLGFDVYTTAGTAGNFTPSILCALLAVLIDFRILLGLSNEQDEIDQQEAQGSRGPDGPAGGDEELCEHGQALLVANVRMELMQPIVDATVHHFPYLLNPPEGVSDGQVVAKFLSDVGPHVEHIVQRHYSEAANRDAE